MKLVVLYGSETGNAQDVAEQIGRQALARNLSQVHVSAMDAFPLHQLRDSHETPDQTLGVFVVSTTGDGEVPANMKQTWRLLLRKSLGTDWLLNQPIAVFGLGDSSYAKYNAVARRLQARLLQLGAKELVPRGLGDDQHALGYLGALNPWLKQLWSAVFQVCPLPDGFVIDDTPKPMEKKFRMRVEAPKLHAEGASKSAALKPLCDPLKSSFYAPPTDDILHPKDGVCVASVVENKRLTRQDWEQDVRHLEFDISSCPSLVNYRAGAVAVVYPENMAGVQEFLQHTRLQEDSEVHFEPLDEHHGSTAFLAPFPSPCQAGVLARRFLDLQGIPRRSFFEQLSLHAVDPEEKEKLLELASPEGTDLLYDYCIRERKSYVEVLSDFPSVSVDCETLVHLIPPLKPRQYSIASSSLLHPGRLELVVAIVDFLTPYKRRRFGVCSKFFQELESGAQVALWIKKSMFTPSPLSSPMLLIGPGTGLASMRAVVQERQFLLSQHSASNGEMHTNGFGDAVGDVHLYFGCRHRDRDYLYQEELEGFVQRGLLKSLQVAFSRDQGYKIYVQTKLAENKQQVYELLMQPNSIVLIAGSAKRMPNDVYEVLRDILRAQGKLTLKDAELLMKKLAREKRYVVESWS